MTYSAIVIAVGAVLLVALPAARAKPMTVAVDVGQLDKQTYDQIDAVNLEKKVVVRLVQEGFAVVAATEHPHVRVEYIVNETLRITVSADSTRRHREVAISDVSDLGTLHLEIAQKTVELVRQMPKPKEDIAEPAPAPVSSPVPSKLPATAKHHTLTLKAMIGGVLRGNTDAYFGVGLAYPLKPTLAITGTFAFVPASAAVIDVLEWQGQLGVAWLPVRTKQWVVSTGVSLGFLVHQFSRQDESGTRTDLLLTTPITLRRSLSKRLAAGLRLAPGFTNKSREHTEPGVQLWHRSSARVEVMAQLSWEL